MKNVKLFILVLLISLLSCLTATGEVSGFYVTTEDGSFPELNAEGFLDGAEFCYENADAGIWRYCSGNLKVEIIRHVKTDKPKQIWYEAEIWCRNGEAFRMIPNDADNWMKSKDHPYQVARRNQTVFAINSDYASHRNGWGKKTGIIIRNGVIINSRHPARNVSDFLNLDNMAILADGSFRVFWPDEYTAEEFLDMGAKDVLAFGPWLIDNGKLNEDGLTKYGNSNAPRTAIGMIENGHFIAIVMDGRRSDSTGCSVRHMAELLLARNCTVGFNLDGGKTSAMLFMGTQINQVGEKSTPSARDTAEILGIGTSGLVPQAD